LFRRSLQKEGVFQATTIMAKHAEEYSPHLEDKGGYPKTFVPGKESIPH
jgi:cytochrome c-type biogenesis protein CcmE